jgi:hypothetical protein
LSELALEAKLSTSPFFLFSSPQELALMLMMENAAGCNTTNYKHAIFTADDSGVMT